MIKLNMINELSEPHPACHKEARITVFIADWTILWKINFGR